jgi:hypothetical protein
MFIIFMGPFEDFTHYTSMVVSHYDIDEIVPGIIGLSHWKLVHVFHHHF